MKLRKFSYEEVEGYTFICKPCNSEHVFYTKTGNPQTEWEFNGNMDVPTFTPSLKNSRPGYCCHLNLTDGILMYHSDCTHAAVGVSTLLSDGYPDAD